MSSDYLHNHPDFPDLLRILNEKTGIDAGLIEKDYWIMHVLHGLKKLGYVFELKGGTSLSKGYKIIDRFSEDIDIHITPPADLNVNENPKNTKEGAVKSRRSFYDWLASDIKIDGIVSVERDTAFDDTEHYRSGGIRVYYENKADPVEGLKEGILLEAGFDTVTPNQEITLSSWAYDEAVSSLGDGLVDNRAIDIACYHPGYTFVEKLQTIATRYRQEQQGLAPRRNFMRQYYDVAKLLGHPQVQSFIGTDGYEAHKAARFPKQDREIPVAENEAFLLNDPELRADFIMRYKSTAALYYNGQPEFSELLDIIQKNLPKL